MTTTTRTPRRATFYTIDGTDGKSYRVKCGEDAKGSRLSNDLVEEIRRAFENDEGGYRKLAKRFGVSRETVRDVVTYRRRIRG